MAAAAASASSASNSIIGQTTTPSAARASSSGSNWARSTGSSPSPVLYPGHSALRNDSMTWSVATPRWVAPPSSIPSTLPTTPRTARSASGALRSKAAAGDRK